MKAKFSKNIAKNNIHRYLSQNNNLRRYRKIYKIEPVNNINDPSDERISTEKQKQKIKQLKLLYGDPNKNRKLTDKWNNLTKPKLPFTKRSSLPKDVRIKKIESLKPSVLYHDNHVIHWIRSKYSSSVIEKSLYTIFPDREKEKTEVDETELRKKQKKMLEFLKSSKEPTGREKFVKINPKYFYNTATFEKIKKLRDIFLEFDVNRNNEMSLDELALMFNQNDIKTNEDELAKLFFKNKKYKKKDYFKLYLNFYQFLKFSLSQEHEFRLFMRKIKSKYDKENKDNKNYSKYLPMNLNLLLDYFISKSKEKSSLDKINKAIKIMDKSIKNLENLDVKKSENAKNFQPEKSDNDNPNLSNSKENNIDDLFQNINFKELIDEFGILFSKTNLNDFEKKMEINSPKINKYRTDIKDFNFNKNKKSTSSKINEIKRKMLFDSEIDKVNKPILYNVSKNKNDIYENAIKRSLNQTAVIKMNMDNYKKFHSIQLALDATKEDIETIKKSKLKSQMNYGLKKYIDKNNVLKSLPLLEKKNKFPFNNKNKKSFLFKCKNLSKSNSMELFTKKELINVNKNSLFNEANYNFSNNRRTNQTSFKLNKSKSSNYFDKEKLDFSSISKLDYVPLDLYK